MRPLVAALVSLLVFWASETHALSVCPVSDFLLTYNDHESVELSTDQMETVEAAVARARQCDLQSVEVFSTSTAANQGLWQSRVEAVREALITHGIDDQLVEARTVTNASIPDWWDSGREEGVVTLIRFR